jgi:hypothetical protein
MVAVRWLVCFCGIVFQEILSVHVVARVAQSVERKALNLVVMGSSPISGAGAIGIEFCLAALSVGVQAARLIYRPIYP